MTKRYPRTMLATACVPWDENFNFDEGAFRDQVALLTGGGIRSIYLFGTAGEGYAVSREQFIEITAAFADEMGKTPGTMPMAGIISQSMSEVMERINIGLGMGVSDFQISFPSWGAVTVDEGMRYLRTICERFPNARFMHYNNGFRSKTRLAMEHYKKLAEDVENIVAVKSTGVGLYDLQDFHSEEIPIQFFNLELAYGYASMMSETALLISYCNLSFKKAWEYFHAGVNRDYEAIVNIHREIGIAEQILNKTLPGGKMDGSYDKLFVKAHLPHFSQRLHPPYEGVSDGEYEVFISEIREKLPEWR